jgi:hypothetical protein
MAIAATGLMLILGWLTAMVVLGLLICIARRIVEDNQEVRKLTAGPSAEARTM